MQQYKNETQSYNKYSKIYIQTINTLTHNIPAQRNKMTLPSKLLKLKM